jgi:hypothetical protein
MSRISRRLLLGEAAGLALAPLALAAPPACAQSALLDPADPKAQALKYVEDAHRASGRTGDATCASCGLYQGKQGNREGPCQLFPGKAVKAAGWCTSWAPQM